jgi:hypothetical protein
MKKVLIILLLFPLVSFENIKTKYWVGHCTVRMRPTFHWDLVRIIKASDKKTATLKFKEAIRKDAECKGGYIEKESDPTRFSVTEILPENIIK